jgi:hypothetical protein
MGSEILLWVFDLRPPMFQKYNLIFSLFMVNIFFPPLVTSKQRKCLFLTLLI